MRLNFVCSSGGVSLSAVPFVVAGGKQCQNNPSKPHPLPSCRVLRRQLADWPSWLVVSCACF